MSVGRRARVFNHGRFAGILEEVEGRRFRFTYAREYLADQETDAISLTLPKRPEPYEADVLFAYFFGLLSEGSTRMLQARLLRIDEADSFGLLLATGRDAVGSVTVEPDES